MQILHAVVFFITFKRKKTICILYFYHESITKKYLYMYIEILYFMVNNELNYIRL